MVDANGAREMASVARGGEAARKGSGGVFTMTKVPRRGSCRGPRCVGPKFGGPVAAVGRCARVTPAAADQYPSSRANRPIAERRPFSPDRNRARAGRNR